jgi:hypothetical protein
MKKTLLAALLCCLAAMSAKAQVLLFDSFSYPDGNITNTSGNIWKTHSGTQGDSFVKNGKYEINQARTDDIGRAFTNVGTVLYASFTINMTNYPNNPFGSYFAHFKDATNGIEFRGRVSAQTYNTYPGTYRLAIANNLGDGTAAGNAYTAVFPMDLATNTTYQVVMKYNITDVNCQLWVNPSSESDPSSPTAFDSGAVTNALAAFAFRQTTGEGAMQIDNLIVGNTFADVVTNAATVPVISIQPLGTTNYSGNNTTLEVAATGTGPLTYQWNLEGNPVSGATSQTLVLSNLQGTDQGNYTVTITGPGGNATSAAAYVSVNTTPTVPFFTTQPQGITNSEGNTVALSAVAGGTGPLSYQWNFFGTNLPGATGSSLTLGPLTTNLSGPYTVTATGAAGSTDSSTAYLQVNPPQAVSIGFLHTLVDANYLATDTTSLWTITGTVVSATNVTSGNTSSYYVQDNTGGINLFVSGGQAFRPQIGDIVMATGPLQTFNSTLELALNTNNTFHSFSILSHNNPLPAPMVIPNTFSNNIAVAEAAESTLIMLTNVYFPSTGTTKFTSASNVIVTNSTGVPFTIRVNAGVLDVIGKNIPTFAWTVSGVLVQNLANTATPRNAGYQLVLTRYQDVVATPPTAVTSKITASGSNEGLTWTAQPYTYSYSVLGSASVTGPYTPIVTGLTFTNTSGIYVDTNAATASKFYKIVSP